MSSLFDDAKELKVDQVAPGEQQKQSISEDEFNKFIKQLADAYGIPNHYALVGFTLLCLKGACNASAPDTMTVTIVDPDGNQVDVAKFELVYACRSATGHTFIRRMAEYAAIHIGEYAELNGLAGDLANKLNKMAIAKGEGPLTPKEKSWASSFSQTIPNLEEKAVAQAKLDAKSGFDDQVKEANKNYDAKKAELKKDYEDRLTQAEKTI